MDDSIPAALTEAAAAIGAALHLPDNAGVELRGVGLAPRGQQACLIGFVQGNADEELLATRVLEPLDALAAEADALSPSVVAERLPVLRKRVTGSLSEAVRAMLSGETLLFIDGTPAVLLVQTRAPGDKTREGSKTFGARLPDNVSLLRARMQNPALVARPLRFQSGHADGAVLIYLEGRAGEQIVADVRTWLEQHGSEEALRRGLGSGARSLPGMIPHMTSTIWPAQVSALLDSGHVGVLVEGLPVVYLAPVTAPALLFSPDDEQLRRPLSVILRTVRVLLGALVVLSPAAVIALSEYHQEMIPTPFLLGLAAVRESAGLPMVAEVIVLELLQDLMRLAAARLPGSGAAGAGLVASILFILVLVITGLIQPLTSFASIVVATAALALPGFDTRYMARVWRWPMIAGSSLFGLFGMAAVTLLLLIYCVQATSFQVPFLGESGLQFATSATVAARPAARGGKARAKRSAVW